MNIVDNILKFRYFYSFFTFTNSIIELKYKVSIFLDRIKIVTKFAKNFFSINKGEDRY